MSAARSTRSSNRSAAGRHEQLRPLVARLAERFATEDGQAILRELQLVGRELHRRRSPLAPWLETLRRLGRKLSWLRPATPKPQPPFSDVGIWKAVRNREGWTFVRDPKCRSYWRSFADVEQIPAKGRRKRVVYLGESVARGLFYDPGYKPSEVLKHLFEQMGVGDECEVVDLAKTALTPQLLFRLLRQVALLKPDCLVLFAGNNWHYEYNRNNINPGELGAIASALRQGVTNCKAVLDRKHLRGVAEMILAATVQVGKELGIPVVVVVPEFNLADWWDDYPLPLLKLEKGEEWHALKAQAEQMATAGAWTEVERLALAMREIDGGLTPQPGRFLAQAALARDARAEAHRHLEAARDAAGCFPIRSTPRSLAVIQRVLREGAARHGFFLVDLPELMKKAGEIPGRKYFLDYCHMSAEGIVFAMRPTAAAIATALFPRRVLPAVQGLSVPPVEPSLAAAAHLLAAIHLGIQLQPEEIVAHHLREALRLDARMAQVLQRYLITRIAGAPDWLDKDLVEQCPLPNLKRQLNIVITHPAARVMPFRLLDVSAAQLPAEWLHGCLAGMADQLKVLHERRRLNLLELRFRMDTMQTRNEAYCVEKMAATEFRVLCPPQVVATLELCCRVPDALEAAPVLTLLADGAAIWSGPVGRDWQRITVPVDLTPASPLGKKLILRWPPVATASARAWQRAQLAADRGEGADVYPVSGEIHSAILTW